MKKPVLSHVLQQRRYQLASPYISRTVLDVGCGQATLADYVPEIETYVGIDTHAGLLQLARQLYPQHCFYQIDLDQHTFPIELAGQQFETITMIALLEHLAHPQCAVQQACRLLTPNGYLVVTTPTPLGHRVHYVGASLGLFYQEAVDEYRLVWHGC